MVYYVHHRVLSRRTLHLVSVDYILNLNSYRTLLVSLSSSLPPALSLSTLTWRYVRQFVRLDSKEALQYVYTVTLGADQPGVVGKEQLELAWDLVRRIIVLANAGPAWDELVGGFRADGMRFVCIFSSFRPLLAYAH
jgi:nuclear pore complex protein Nup93